MNLVRHLHRPLYESQHHGPSVMMANFRSSCIGPRARDTRGCSFAKLMCQSRLERTAFTRACLVPCSS